MDFNELKKIAKELGGILVMNGNTPEFVVLPYENFKKPASPEPAKPIVSAADEDNKTIEKLNAEILALKEEIRQKEEAELVESETELAEENLDKIEEE